MELPYLARIILLLAALALQTGCDPVGRHKFLITFFDEVPTLPPADQFCEEADEQKASAAVSANKRASAEKPKYESSIHQPYGEKRCNGCHESEKTSISGLLKPENELCFMCHPKILQHAFAHGPAAEGGCLGCHLPHEAGFPSLLVREPAALCDKCHSEPRNAQEMHDKIKATGVICLDCHDPHSGASKYFLK